MQFIMYVCLLYQITPNAISNIYIYVVWWLFLGRHNMHIYSPQTGSLQPTKVWIPPKSSLMSQWALSGLFTVPWWGITYRSRNNSETPASSPKPTSEGVSTKAGNPEHLAYPSERPFQVTQNTSQSHLCCLVCPKVTLSSLGCLLPGKGLSEPGQFQGLPKAIFSCLCSGLRSFPVMWDYFNLRGNCYVIEREEPEPSVQPFL